jgi:hypothetical protein
MQTTRRVVVVLAIMTGVILSTAGAAGATTTLKFHAHIDAYGLPGFGCIAKFDAPNAGCVGEGYNGNAGTSMFVGKVQVGWCDLGPPCSAGKFALGRSWFAPETALPRPPMPSGYSRMMDVQSANGRSNWLYGAVRLPNGPFVVLAGMVDGHSVVAQDPNKAVESDGGPLFLYVGWHGQVDKNYEYVLGFRGYLRY